MKNILILTDFSNNSWNSIEYTLALFQNKRCNFYLLNAKKGSYEIMDELVYDNLLVTKKKNQKEKFDELLVKISKSTLKGEHIFTSILADKDIIESARHQIEEKKIDLVVIGSNGMSSDGRKNNISPTSEDIITKLKCSILVVPNEAQFSKLKEIAFPTDYTNFYEAKLLQNISSLLSFHES
ncbi:MAG: universal stress protein, partial [Lutibacter sp.]|nr:universal stress protein [Lutibacter sp.]